MRKKKLLNAVSARAASSCHKASIDPKSFLSKPHLLAKLLISYIQYQIGTWTCFGESITSIRVAALPYLVHQLTSMQSLSSVRVQPGQCQLCLARRALPTSSRRGRVVSVSAQVSVQTSVVGSVAWHARCPSTLTELITYLVSISFDIWVSHLSCNCCRKPVANLNGGMR